MRRGELVPDVTGAAEIRPGSRPEPSGGNKIIISRLAPVCVCSFRLALARSIAPSPGSCHECANGRAYGLREQGDGVSLAGGRETVMTGAAESAVLRKNEGSALSGSEQYVFSGSG